jgi:hypothetical protein
MPGAVENTRRAKISPLAGPPARTTLQPLPEAVPRTDQGEKKAESGKCKSLSVCGFVRSPVGPELHDIFRIDKTS